LNIAVTSALTSLRPAVSCFDDSASCWLALLLHVSGVRIRRGSISSSSASLVQCCEQLWLLSALQLRVHALIRHNCMHKAYTHEQEQRGACIILMRDLEDRSSRKFRKNVLQEGVRTCFCSASSWLSSMRELVVFLSRNLISGLFSDSLDALLCWSVCAVLVRTQHTDSSSSNPDRIEQRLTA
jgi:hypothetical protein